MAIYPTMFGHVDIPEPMSRRDDRPAPKKVGYRLVRLADSHTDPRKRRDGDRP